ncbi:MAG: OB-fold nucleic acid binding domain-containing protein [Planctomycetota bacterium]|jgi:asparaginyl-tRNA synthetase
MISGLQDFIGKEVTLSGWLYKNRPSGKVQFLMLRDGSGLCQCVIEKASLSEDLFDQIKHLGQESSLKVTGIVRQEPRSPGGVELSVTAVQINCPAVDYPITPKEHGGASGEFGTP